MDHGLDPRPLPLQRRRDGRFARCLGSPRLSAELKDRISDESITELIAATNPTMEGDATAMYLARAGIAVVRVGVAEPSFFPALVELTAAIHRQVRVGESLMVVG